MRSGPVSAEYFIDTSALLKAYIQEKGTDIVDRILQENALRMVSSVGLIEAVSVLQRLHSVEGVLSDEQFSSLCARLLQDAASGQIEVLNVTPRDVKAAISLEMTQYLTTVDAVQIALALELGDNVVLVSSDEKLNRVAAEVGLRVLNPAG